MIRLLLFFAIAQIALSQPPAPTGLIATAGNASVKLSWNASTGATSYRLKRSLTSGGTYSVVVNTTFTDFTDSGLTNGTTYYYMVSALNSSGQQSANSSKVSATPSAPGTITMCAGTVPQPGQVLTYTSGNCWTSSPAQVTQIQVNGQSVPVQRPILNFTFPTTGPSGINYTAVDNPANNSTDFQIQANTAYLATLDRLLSGGCDSLQSSNGTVAYTASMAPACKTLTVYQAGKMFVMTVDVGNPGSIPVAISLNIDSIGVKSIKQIDGTTDPAPNQIVAGQPFLIFYDGLVFRLIQPLETVNVAKVSDCTGMYRASMLDGSNLVLYGIALSQLPVAKTWNVITASAPVQLATCQN